MNPSNKKINKLLALELIRKGDDAVIEKILEFQDTLEDIVERYNSDSAVIQGTINAIETLKGEVEIYISKKDTELSDKLSEIPSQLDTLKSMLEDKMSEGEMSHKEHALKMEATVAKLASEISAIKASMPTMPDLSEYDDKLEEIKASIPTIPEQVKETPEELRDKLESLKDDDRLDKSAIKGLDEELKSIRSIKGATSPGMFGMKQMRMVSFSFTGNDSDTVFYLPKEPGAKGLAIWAYYQGQHLQKGTHFTVSNKTFTCTGFTPQTGSYIEGFIII